MFYVHVSGGFACLCHGGICCAQGWHVYEIAKHCPRQIHYREVPQLEILMEQELRFELDLGRLAYLNEKKTIGPIMSNF